MGDEMPEKDERAGDGIQRSGMWRKPKPIRQAQDKLQPKAPKNIDDWREELAVRARNAQMSVNGQGDAVYWKEQYWRAERELRDKSDECSFLKSEVKRLSGRATAQEAPVSETPNAQQRIAELEQEVAKQKEKTRGEMKLGLLNVLIVFTFMLIGWVIHVNGFLFNEDEVNAKIAPFVATQPELSLETLATGEFEDVFLKDWKYWNDLYHVVYFTSPSQQWVKLDSDTYAALKDFYVNKRWRNTNVSSVIRIILSNRKAKTAKSSAPPTSIPISADSPKPSDAKAMEDKPADPMEETLKKMDERIKALEQQQQQQPTSLEDEVRKRLDELNDLVNRGVSEEELAEKTREFYELQHRWIEQTKKKE